MKTKTGKPINKKSNDINYHVNYDVVSFFSFLFGVTRSLRMPALRAASQAGPMRNPREETSVVLHDTTRLT